MKMADKAIGKIYDKYRETEHIMGYFIRNNDKERATQIYNECISYCMGIIDMTNCHIGDEIWTTYDSLTDELGEMLRK